jgi:hypothetical protein
MFPFWQCFFNVHVAGKVVKELCGRRAKSFLSFDRDFSQALLILPRSGIVELTYGTWCCVSDFLAATQLPWFFLDLALACDWRGGMIITRIGWINQQISVAIERKLAKMTFIRDRLR